MVHFAGVVEIEKRPRHDCPKLLPDQVTVRLVNGGFRFEDAEQWLGCGTDDLRCSVEVSPVGAGLCRKRGESQAVYFGKQARVGGIEIRENCLDLRFQMFDRSRYGKSDPDEALERPEGIRDLVWVFQLWLDA